MSEATEGYHVLLGVTGSVAAVKVPLIVQQLKEHHPQVEIKVVYTECSRHFFKLSDLPEDVQCYSDVDEWSTWEKMGDPVLHIELRRWADVLVIAPLDANTLAKMACGLCDNLLTCSVRAWDPSRPLLVAPAMNTYMWDHPHTEQHIEKIKTFGCRIIPPIIKKLACGDYGQGAMAEKETIVSVISQELSTLKRISSYTIPTKGKG